MSEHVLLICTVGGSQDPVTRSILHTAPDRVIFLHTAESQSMVQAVRDDLQSYERALPEGATDMWKLSNHESLIQCVKEMRPLHEQVNRWCNNSENHRVLIDITAGTKAMAAALALVAHRWPCRFAYVGGEKRDKNNVGTVVPGSERILICENPWEALAYQPIQDAIRFFNNHQPAAAEQLLKTYTQRSDIEPGAKKQLIAVQNLAAAYANWDAFEHKNAAECMKIVLKAENDLHAVFGNQTLPATIHNHAEVCKKLHECKGSPSQELVFDLLANADRRAAQNRYEDATARLYRAVEALAQFVLHKEFSISSSACPVEKIPPTLCEKWASRINCAPLKLALQDLYTLLDELKHPIGAKFRQLELHDCTSPLSIRNQSILAHGFNPTSRTAFQALRSRTYDLAGQPQLHAHTFPQLPMV